jgi:hypothetical protein
MVRISTILDFDVSRRTKNIQSKERKEISQSVQAIVFLFFENE